MKTLFFGGDAVVVRPAPLGPIISPCGRVKNRQPSQAIAETEAGEEKSSSFWRMIDRAIKLHGAPIVTGFYCRLWIFRFCTVRGISLIISRFVVLIAQHAGVAEVR